MVGITVLADGVDVTAGIDAMSELTTPLFATLLLIVLWYFDVIDGVAFTLFTVFLIVGAAVRLARVANVLRTLSRAGAAHDESDAA